MKLDPESLWMCTIYKSGVSISQTICLSLPNYHQVWCCRRIILLSIGLFPKFNIWPPDLIFVMDNWALHWCVHVCMCDMWAFVCVYVWKISLWWNKSTCDFCHIFLLDKRCSIQLCMVYKRYQMYIYCIHLFIFLSIIHHNVLLAKFCETFGKGV